MFMAYIHLLNQPGCFSFVLLITIPSLFAQTSDLFFVLAVSPLHLVLDLGDILSNEIHLRLHLLGRG
jgi:hypothetical protein